MNNILQGYVGHKCVKKPYNKYILHDHPRSVLDPDTALQTCFFQDCTLHNHNWFVVPAFLPKMENDNISLCTFCSATNTREMLDPIIQLNECVYF